MVFQNYALYPHMTVRENMGFALQAGQGMPKAEIDAEGRRGGADPRPRAASGAQAGQPVRRPAPARRDGPRDRPQPERVPDGRAAVEPGRQAARADAHRDLADPAALRARRRIYVTHDQTEALTLGDRIAVMRAGKLQQVGAPSELYNRPNNLFVAGFIGSPSMNFLPAEIDGDVVKLPFGDVHIPDALRARLQAGPGGGRKRRDRRPAARRLRGRRRSSGSRRRDHLQDQDRRARVDGVGVLRLLRRRGRAGHRRGARGAGPGGRGRRPVPARRATRWWRGSRPPARCAQGQEIELWFNSEHLHLFDPETGRSLLAEQRRGAATGR